MEYYYDTKGKRISEKEFIEIYSNCYYYRNPYAIEIYFENLLKRDTSF